MAGYLKHDGNENDKSKPKKQPKPTESEPVRIMLQTDPDEIQPTADSIAFYGLDHVAEQLGKIAHSFKSYNFNATEGLQSLTISFGGDEMADLTEAFNRIAAALEKLAPGPKTGGAE